jgi:hypothetical protein
MLSLAKHRLHVVAVCIEHEGSVVTRRITLGGVAKPGRAIINPTCLKGGRVKRVHLGAASRRKSGVLLRTVWVEAVDPEDGTFGAIPITASAALVPSH